MLRKLTKWLVFSLVAVIGITVILLVSSILFFQISYFINAQKLGKVIEAKSFDEVCLIHSYSIRRPLASDTFYFTVGDRTVNIGSDWSYSKAGDGIHAAIYLNDGYVEDVSLILTTEAQKILADNGCITLKDNN